MTPRLLFVAAAAALLLVACDPVAPSTERVSVTSEEAQGFGNGFDIVSVSADGNVVAFATEAALVPDDTNARVGNDIYVRDRRAGTTERVSVSSAGTQADGTSYETALSADGALVAFSSNATNLVAGDTNRTTDIFLRDRRAGTTERVSLSSAEVGGNGASHTPALTPDGRYVAFESQAPNLVAGDTNGFNDIFVRDRQERTTVRVSTASGAQANGYSSTAAISDDGRRVAYESIAANLVPGDTNGREDVFVHDRATGGVERVSVSGAEAQSDGYSSDPLLSADGQVVGFTSTATNLVSGDTNAEYDVFVRDRRSGTTTRASVKDGGGQGVRFSHGEDISDDGTVVVFYSDVRGLVDGDTNDATDVFVRDLEAERTERASVSSDGGQGDGPSTSAAVDATGRFVAFWSHAPNLVADDTNRSGDAFLRDRGTGG